MLNTKGKTIQWILFAVLLVIVFVGLIYFQKLQKTSEPTTTTTTTTPTTLEDVEIKKPKTPTTLAERELSDKEKFERDNDAINKALQSGEGCDSIEFDLELRALCEDTLNYNNALKRFDEKLCELIKDEKKKIECLDKVYSALAAQALNPELCNKIKSDSLKQNCLDKIQAYSGRTAESADVCETIGDTVLRQKCLNDFYYSASTESLDESSCDQITETKLKERCVATVIKNIEVVEITKEQSVRKFVSDDEKLEGCDSLVGETEQKCKDDANYDLALSKKDITYCSSIEDNIKKTDCLTVQSANINNFYLRQAISRKSPALCDKVLDEGLRLECLSFAK